MVSGDDDHDCDCGDVDEIFVERRSTLTMFQTALDGSNLTWMDTELLPLLTGAMSACPPVRSLSACAAGCGPSALAALQVEIHLSSALTHFSSTSSPHQARDLKAFKSALDEEEFDVEKKHLVGGVNSTLMQVGLYLYMCLSLYLHLYLFSWQLMQLMEKMNLWRRSSKPGLSLINR